jgi:HEAT repeat protein
MTFSHKLAAWVCLVLVAAPHVFAQEKNKPVPELIEMLESSDKFVRREAAYQLSRLGPQAKEAVPALVKALNDPEQQVWFGSVTALSLIGPDAKEAIPALIQGLSFGRTQGWRRSSSRQIWYRSAFALGNIGPEAIPPLIEALSHKEESIRSGAALALGFMDKKATSAIPALSNALSDPGKDVRQRAAEALASIGPESIPALEKALEHDSPEVRAAATFGLKDLGEQARPVAHRLAELIKRESDPTVTAPALDALSFIGYPQFLPLLIEQLKSDEPAVLQAASNALLLLPEQQAKTIPALIQFLDQAATTQERERAALLLMRMGPAAKTAVPSLVKAARAAEGDARSPFLDALAAIAPESANEFVHPAESEPSK